MIPKTDKVVFAAGSDIKNYFSFFKNGEFVFSTPNSDLVDYSNYQKFINQIHSVVQSGQYNPDIVAYDLHPGYFSGYARNLFPKAVHIPVGHHYAHIASVLAVSPNSKGVIGVAFDGTGYGLDGASWGGEFIIGSKEGFLRRAHFQYLKMPGADKVVLEPWRMAFSLLYSYMSENIFNFPFDFLKLRSDQENRVIAKLFDSAMPLSVTSSCGRLFDAVSSILDITHVVKQEAEAAINLEKCAAVSNDTKWYSFDIQEQQDTIIIGYREFIKSLLSDLDASVDKETIARRFHNSLAHLIELMIKRINSETGLDTVVLSGGVFQNRLLLDLSKKLLQDSGFNVLETPEVSVNDSSLCVGQTYIALEGFQSLK